MSAETDPTELADDEWVTQKVSGSRPDIDAPRPVDFGEVSVVRGRVSPERMYDLVVKGGTATGDDGARYARVGDLRQCGFLVVASPTRRNPQHVSISVEGVWGHSDAAQFVSCFAESEWHSSNEDEEVG